MGHMMKLNKNALSAQTGNLQENENLQPIAIPVWKSDDSSKFQQPVDVLSQPITTPISSNKPIYFDIIVDIYPIRGKNSIKNGQNGFQPQSTFNQPKYPSFDNLDRILASS